MFDFRSKTMAITSAKVKAEKMDGQTVVVRARSRKGRLIFTSAHIDGQPVTVIVDTGSQVTIGNMALQRSLIRRRIWNMPDPVTIQSVTGESMSARFGRLKHLQIDSVRLDNLSVAFADAHIFRQLELDKKPAILLGMNAMRAFDRMSIDFAEKKVRFVLPGTSMRDSIRLARK